MRPKKNVIVVGDAPDVRMLLQVSGGVKVWPAETRAELLDALTRLDGLPDAVVVNGRVDDRKLLGLMLAVLEKLPHLQQRAVWVGGTFVDGRPLWRVAVQPGWQGRLLEMVAGRTARKPGPRSSTAAHKQAVGVAALRRA